MLNIQFLWLCLTVSLCLLLLYVTSFYLLRRRLPVTTYTGCSLFYFSENPHLNELLWRLYRPLHHNSYKQPTTFNEWWIEQINTDRFYVHDITPWSELLSDVSFRSPMRRLKQLALLAVALTGVWLVSFTAVGYAMTLRSSPRRAEPLPQVDWARFTENWVRTRDGEDLGAWLDETDHREGPIVLILHGNGGSRTAALDVARVVAASGCRPALLTHRAHGDSSGRRNDFGYSARADVIAAVDWLQARSDGRPIVVWGRSLGAAAALFAAPELEGRVAGYILECPYRDLLTAVRHRTEVYLWPGVRDVTFHTLRLVSPVILPHVHEIAPLKAAAKVPSQVPVLVLCGDADRRSPADEAEEIHRTLGTRSQLVRIANGKHLQLRQADATAYDKAAAEFLLHIPRSTGLDSTQLGAG